MTPTVDRAKEALDIYKSGEFGEADDMLKDMAWESAEEFVKLHGENEAMGKRITALADELHEIVRFHPRHRQLTTTPHSETENHATQR